MRYMPLSVLLYVQDVLGCCVNCVDAIHMQHIQFTKDSLNFPGADAVSFRRNFLSTEMHSSYAVFVINYSNYFTYNIFANINE